MIRNFCDSCGKEITEVNACVGGYNTPDRLGTEVKTTLGDVIKLELLVSFNGTANKGDFCKYCILDAFNKLDDRAGVTP